MGQLNMSSIYDAARWFAKKSLEAQAPVKGDFERNGILHCGVCQEPKQKFQKFPFKRGEQVQYEVLKVGINCKCQRDKEIELKKAEEAKKAIEAVKRLKSLSLMDKAYEIASFKSCEVTDHNRANLRLCYRYAGAFEKMEAKNKGLLLYGDVGTGKSYAAACIANYLMERQIPVIMTSFIKILNNFDNEKMIQRMMNTRLIIIDDLGAERSTDYALERVYAIIDERVRMEKPMIITTNLTIDEMKAEKDIRYERIYDRIFPKCFPIHFTGPSWRKKEAANNFEDMKELLRIGDDLQDE